MGIGEPIPYGQKKCRGPRNRKTVGMLNAKMLCEGPDEGPEQELNVTGEEAARKI